jgi:hypothetical protein
MTNCATVLKKLIPRSALPSELFCAVAIVALTAHERLAIDIHFVGSKLFFIIPVLCETELSGASTAVPELAEISHFPESFCSFLHCAGVTGGKTRPSPQIFLS